MTMTDTQFWALLGSWLVAILFGGCVGWFFGTLSPRQCAFCRTTPATPECGIAISLWCRIGLHDWFHQVVDLDSWRPYEHRLCERCGLREDHPSLPDHRRSPPDLLGMPPYGAASMLASTAEGGSK